MPKKLSILLFLYLFHIIVSNQKVSALMKQLVDAGKVEKVVDKKRSYFKIAD